MSKWKNPSGNEPELKSRMFWDLAKDACIFCDAGEFPFKHTTEGRTHPQGDLCESAKFHDMNTKGVNPFRQALIMSKLEVWTPMTLASIIVRCDQEYWKNPNKTTTLTDTEYDQVVERLRAIAPDHPQLEKIGE